MTSHPGLLLPLCTSSASLALSAFQFPLFLAFLPKHPSPSHHNSSRSTKPTSSASLTGRPLSHFWARFLVPGAGLVVACAATSTLAGALSARWLAQHGHLETTEVARWYAYGSVAAAGHFAFAPAVIPLIRRMVGRGEEVEDREDEEVAVENEKDQGRWFVWHTVRTVTVDLAAVVCFAKGVALSLWIV